MSDVAGPPARATRPGRPRLFEPDVERQRLMDAAVEVLRRNGGNEATVADILAEAGLSTRAFYRHFHSKEDVVRALYRRDAESFGRHLRRAMAQAPDPTTALETWVDELLSLAYDRRRRERMAAFSSKMVAQIVAGDEAERLGVELLAQPLHEVLTQGRASGAFPLTTPDGDVRMINALTWEAISWGRDESLKPSRRDALGNVLRFVLPALGAAPRRPPGD